MGTGYRHLYGSLMLVSVPVYFVPHPLLPFTGIFENSPCQFKCWIHHRCRAGAYYKQFLNCRCRCRFSSRGRRQWLLPALCWIFNSRTSARQLPRYNRHLDRSYHHHCNFDLTPQLELFYHVVNNQLVTSQLLHIVTHRFNIFLCVQNLELSCLIGTLTKSRIYRV